MSQGLAVHLTVGASYPCSKIDGDLGSAPLPLIPTLTRALDGDLQVSEVLLIGKDLDTIRWVSCQCRHLLVHQADDMGGQVLHVGVLGVETRG